MYRILKMRLRARILYKLLVLIAACLIVLLIFVSAFEKNTSPDEFLTLLRNTRNDISTEMLQQTVQLTTVQAQSQKHQQLLNLTKFDYLINNELCANYKKELMAILLVTSYVGHDNLRSAHRQAISQLKLSEMGMQRVFLLADIPPKEHFITHSQINNEQQKFGDLLQGNFHEAYRNLSFKHVMGLQWAATNCQKAKFIIKLDDDIIYDIFHLKRYMDAMELESLELATSNALLAGYVLENKPAIRNQANKWYVTPEEYKRNVYPPYLSGWLYITNPKTALRLVERAHQEPIFWIDDTWVTGILREALDIPLQRLNFWFSANPDFINCCVRDLKESNLECEFYAGPNGGDNKLLVDFLHNVEKCYYDECSKRLSGQSLKDTCIGTYRKFLPDHGNAEVKMVPLGR